MRQTSPGGYWISPLVPTALSLSSTQLYIPTQVNKRQLTSQPLHQATVALYVVELHLGTTFRSRQKRKEVRNTFILLKELVHVNPVVILIGRWQCKYQVIRRPADGQTFDFACVCVHASKQLKGWHLLKDSCSLYANKRLQVPTTTTRPTYAQRAALCRWAGTVGGLSPLTLPQFSYLTTCAQYLGLCTDKLLWHTWKALKETGMPMKMRMAGFYLTQQCWSLCL